MTQISREPDAASPRRRLQSGTVGAVCGVGTFLVVAGFTYALCFGAMLAVVGTLVGMAIDVVIGQRIGRRYGLKAHVVFAIVLALCLGATGWRVVMPTRTAMFERAFHEPPVGINNLDARHWYMGPDWVDVMTFSADDATVDRLLKSRTFVLDEETIGTYKLLEGDNWRPRLWRALSVGSPRDPLWRTAPPLADPRLYRWSGESRDILVLWDPPNDQVYCVSGKH